MGTVTLFTAIALLLAVVSLVAAVRVMIVAAENVKRLDQNYKDLMEKELRQRLSNIVNEAENDRR